MTANVKKIFGEHITEEFVQENLDLFLAIEEGGEGAAAAYTVLGEKSAKAFVEGTDFAEVFSTSVDDIKAKIDNLLSSDPQYSVTGTADFS
jgi:hypothetical protein